MPLPRNTDFDAYLLEIQNRFASVLTNTPNETSLNNIKNYLVDFIVSVGISHEQYVSAVTLLNLIFAVQERLKS